MSSPEVRDAAGDSDHSTAVFVVTTVTLVLATVFVACRMFSRAMIVRNVGADDYIMLVAWLMACFLCVAIELAAALGLGRSNADIPDETKPTLRKCQYIFSVLYNPALMATKTSILIFYLRLARNTQKLLRMASWVVLVIVNLAGAVLTLLNIFQCRPINAAWDPYLTNRANCVPLLTEFVCSAPVNIITDLAILALPIPVLTAMRLPPRQKIILVFTFSFGIFVTIVDVIRIYYLQKAIGNTPVAMSDGTATLFDKTLEFSHDAFLSLMWSAVEVNVGITIACVPTLKPLILRILPAMLYDPDGSRVSTSQNMDSKQTPDPTPARNGSDNNNSAPAPEDPGTAPQEPLTAQTRDTPDTGMVSIRDFLARRDVLPPAAQNPRRRSDRRHTASTLASILPQERSVYFGFVNMKTPRSILHTSSSESWRYCSAVTVLFFVWGFTYGLLNTLNNVIVTIAKISKAEAVGLTTIYFGAGYFFGPLLVGRWLISHSEHHGHSRRHRRNSRYADPIGGFRITFIIGLLIFDVGIMAFWPSAVLTAFAGFMVSNFIVGFGLGVLETAANPFLALCGPMRYSEMRLLLAQGVQAVATVLSGLLAQRVFFADVTGARAAQSLLDIQWTYLAMTLFCALLALFFYYMPLPEASQGELELLASRLPSDPRRRSLGGLALRDWTLALAVLAQWTYTAAQESMSIYFTPLLVELSPVSATTASSADDSSRPDAPGLGLGIPDYLLLAHAAFAVSRFAAACLAYLSAAHPTNRLVPAPRTVLACSAALAALSALLIVVLRPGDAAGADNNNNRLIVPIIVFYLAEGPLWPLIFALGLRGQGGRTKRAGTWLTMGASGPAFWPYVMFGIVEEGGSLRTAFVVVVVLLAFTTAYPVFLGLVPDARKMVDVGPGCGGGVDLADGDGDVDGAVGGGRPSGGDAGGPGGAAADRGRRKSSVLGWRAVSWGGRKKETALSTRSESLPMVGPEEDGRRQQQQQEQQQEQKQEQQEQQQEQRQQQPLQRREQQQRAPWENLELDTSILGER